ncbi:hypothetical protein FQA39_LY11788 [Lamprigera yunnana]|nr:hypothetical protein FQA39_LY11788 [Lamprigera yunnana]
MHSSSMHRRLKQMSNVSSMMESSNLQQKRLEEASSSNSEPSSSEQTLNSHKSELIIQCVNVVSSSNSKDNIGEERETLTVTRSNSLKNEINKPTYLQIHRHSLSTGISSVNKLQGRYEGISKSTDNTLNANTTIHSKANVTENAESRKTVLIKPSISNDGSKGTFKSELTTKLFQPSQSEVSPVETKETTDANRVTTNTINNKNLEETPEQLLSKTKSNIEKLQNNLSTKLSSDTIEKLRNKYSPAGFGYPKGGVYKRQFSEPSKIPLPKPKIAEKPKIIPEIKAVLVKEVLVLQDDVYKTQTAPITEGIKDENSNVVINLQHVESKTEDNVKAPKDLTNSSKSLSDATDNSDISKEKSTSTFSCGLCKNEDSIPKENTKIHEKKSSDKVFSSHAVHNSKNGVNQDTDRIEEKEIPRSILKQPQIPDTVKETEHTDNIEIDVEYSKIEFANPEDKHFIVRRSSSEDSIYKIESLLADFVMDKKPKEKKRSNSFRKLLTGGLFGRDKKKTEENKLKQKKDGGVSSENAHNESQLFDRNSSRRHTVDSSNSRREIQKNTNAISGSSHYQTPVTSYRRTADEHDRYTEMSSSGSFVSNRPPKYSSEHYLPMGNGNSNLNSNNNKDIHLNRETVSKYIDTSSSSSITIDFDRNSTYQNALIAQAEMRKIRESGNGPNKHLQGKNRTEHHSSSPEMFRDNPSQQAGNTSQNLQLVKPKALIPINSERPLPNPYHTKHEKLKNIDGYENLEIGQTLERNLNFDNSKPLSQKTNVVFEDVYGTVFDCVNPHQQLENRNELGLRCISPEQKNSKSLESSKLKLPPNREKIDLQPRIRSPIPQAKVSTEKIIATELLKNKRSPSRSSTNLQEQPKDDSRYSSPTRPSSYQGSNIYENTFHFSEKASPTRDQVYPNSSPKMEDRIAELSKVKNNKHYLLAAEWHRKQREFDKSPAIETPQITTNVMVHVNPSDENSLYNNVTPSSGTKKKNMQTSSPVPLVQEQASPRSINTSFNNLSLHSTYQQNSPSPSSKEDKQHILQNVEAFYWRELKKLKDKEEQDILNYRRQQIQFYGYVEDPVLSRRSRSVSPNVQRGRRSLSLPRDVRPIQNPTRMTILGPEPIPEGRPVIAKKPIPLPTETSPLRQPLQKNPNFIRNSFERSTIGPIGVNKPYLPADGLKGNKQTGPIFKRGSLAVGEYSLENPYQLCKRVSFESNQNSSHPSSWPTKNGFTKSPPTRRIEREVPLDDEVFLPNGFQPNFSKRTGDLYERRRVEREQYRTQQGYAPYYGVVQRQLNYPERSVQDEFVPHKEPIYVSTGSKKITVSNKVCDIYGQIHDSKQNLSNSSKEYDRTRYQNQDNAINSQQYGQIRQSGLMYGELKSPSVAYQSYNQLSTQPNFVRGTRLTASVNDMYKRYPYENVRVVDDRPPSDTRYFTDKSAPMPQRPLPPVPERRDSRAISVRKLIRGYAPISDNESGSEAGEVQRILQTGSKQNRINLADSNVSEVLFGDLLRNYKAVELILRQNLKTVLIDLSYCDYKGQIHKENLN